MPASYYFGSGTRRHLAKYRKDKYILLYCGMSGRISTKLYPSSVEANCKHCLRAADRLTA